ncbi:MAG: peptidylprolyl isomerase [Bacteroidetes bacterium]|nr:MAG: peptidylprolyl isomerase [Bacteroidota bacterium]
MLSIGDTVKVHYTGQLKNGKVFDTTISNDPILFTLGDEMMIPGFEEAVLGMKEGQKKTVTIKAIDAYGDYDKELLMEVDKKEFLGDKEVKEGDTVEVPTEEGVFSFKIHKIGDDKIMLDGNSELAGKDVIFDIEIIEVQKAEVISDMFDEDEFGSFEDEFGSSSDLSEDDEYLDAENY